MSELEFEFDILNRVFDGKGIRKDEAYKIFLESESNTQNILKIAENIRNQFKGNTVSLSKTS